MQIEIYAPSEKQVLPDVKWNYEELKKQLLDGLASYKGVVYTEETIGQAKKDRAALNKLADVIDTRRKEIKAQYLQPYEKFEVEAKELAKLVKDQSGEIDKKVKAFDEQRKEQKLAEIKGIYSTSIGELSQLVPYGKLHNPRWLNVTTSIASVTQEIESSVDKIKAGLESIDSLNLEESLVNQVKGVFLRDFDLAAAIAEKDRILKQREELERIKAEREVRRVEVEKQMKAQQVAAPQPEPANKPQPEPVPEKPKVHEPVAQIDFRVWVTQSQADALKAFLQKNSIKYCPVPKN